jgi:DNA-binding NtrC family response regulator
MTSAPRSDGSPRILLLWEDEGICQVVHYAFTLEGYRISATQSARRALDRIARSSRPYVVVMDNFLGNDEARTFAAKIAAAPELHQRVRVVGVGIEPAPHLIALDAFIELPFSVDQLLDPIAAVCTDLQTAMGSP